jgi:eukaryotic-like serine/threonine-protein kinase
MDPRQYNRAHEVFLEACERTGVERDLYVKSACAGDDDVHAIVLRMLQRDGQEISATDVLPSPSNLAELLAEQAGAAEDAHDEGPLPEQIGPYRVLRKIGQGGMGVVFEAEQDQPRRRVAVKMLKQGLASGGLAGRFRREIELLGRLQHPGIARIYSAGSITVPGGSVPYFAMEFAEGASITRFAEESNLSTAQRVELVAMVCDAVHFAHQQGVVHRDLKPQNILAARGDADAGITLKILDFGIARVLDDAQRGVTIQTEAGQVIGTLCYMSPEQLDGDNASIDVRTDVYTLGVLLYEMLTGHVPHEIEGKSLPQAVRIVTSDPPTRLSSVRKDLRGDLEAIVVKALERNKAARYASASEFAADLRRYLRGEPVSARQLTAFYQIRRFAGRHRALVWSSAATVVCLLLGIVGTSVGLYLSMQSERRALTSEQTARRESYRLALAAADATWRNDPLRARAALESAPTDLRGWEWHHFLNRMDDLQASFPSRVPPALGVDSATGLLAAVVTPSELPEKPGSGARVEIRKLTTGLVEAICHTDTLPRTMSFSANARRLAVVEDRDGVSSVTVYDSRTGARLQRATIADQCCALSPDGTLLAFLTPERTLMVRTIDTGETIAGASLAGPDRPVMVRFTPSGQIAVDLIDARKLSKMRHYSPKTAGEVEPAWIVDSAQPLYDFREGLVIGSPPGSLRMDRRAVEVWPAESPAAIRLLKGHAGNLRGARISPDGGRIASWSGDSSVRIWNTSSGECEKIIGLAASLTDLRWSPDGLNLSGVTGNNDALLLSAATSESLVLVGHKGFVFHAVFSPDGSLLASGGWNDEVRLWDARTGTLISQVTSPTGALRTPKLVAFSSDGLTLVVERSAWDIPTLLREPGNPRAARADDRAAQSEGDGWMRLASGGRSVSHAGGQLSDLSRNGEVAAEFLEKGPLVISDAQGTPRLTIEGIAEPRRTVALDASGLLAATADTNKVIKIWNLQTGSMIREFEPQPLHIYSMDFSPDGSRLATAGDDSTIVIWDTETWSRLAELRGHTQYVSSVSFSPDGSRLASASGDGTIRIWNSRPRDARKNQESD